jgi:hypothetical protein
MKIIKNALINSVLAIAYIAIVASAIFNGEKLFGSDKSVFVPIMMLCLLVFSVALMGVLVFGRPVMWYLDGAKKEAVKLLLCTLGFILAALVIFLLVLVFA